MRYILSLDAKTATQENHTGGKGASLARLRRQGFKVPSGFIITSVAFQDFLADFGIEVLTQRKDWIQRDLERIRELLLACRIPSHLEQPILEAYKRKLGGLVAVRSSMVGEDTAVASFAGQLDTILNVQGERELLMAVKSCWASLFNWRLLSYLTKQERATPASLLDSFSIAVVVQEMVDAQAAGVAFSADPVTGQPCIVIEAARGLGEAVVRGLVDPDRYVVRGRDGATAIETASPKEPILEEQAVLRLVKTVRRVAELAQAPQDIEWAWDSLDFYLLQSRPITSLVGQRVYSNSMISEMLPGLIKPLVWSVSTNSKLENVMGRIFTELIGPNDIDFTSLAKRIHSRVYADNTMLGQLLEAMGLPSNFFEVMSRDEQAERRQRLPLSLNTLRTMLRLTRFIWRYARVAGEITAFIERHREDLGPYRRADWSDEDPATLLTHIERLMGLYSETMWFNFIGPLNMMIRHHLLNNLVKKWAPEVEPSDLVRGLVGLKSLESNREIKKLASRVRNLDGRFQRLLVEEEDEAIRVRLSSSEEGRRVIRDLDAFMNRYGFLSASGTDLSRTPWVENPTLIWHAVGRASAESLNDRAQKDASVIREEAQRKICDNLNWVQRFFFNRLLTSTITHIRLREESSFLISEDSFEMRRLFLALADRLVGSDYLEERNDIFYLTIDEVQQVVLGELDTGTIKAWVNTRRAEMEADALIEIPDVIYGEHVPTCPISLSEGQEYLSGIVGSSGLVEGLARIVRDPTEAPSTLRREDILIVPFTDINRR